MTAEPPRHFIFGEIMGIHPYMYDLYPNTLSITDVIFSGPATIVFFTDGEKTVVRRMNGSVDNRKIALMYAVLKHSCRGLGNWRRPLKRYATFLDALWFQNTNADHNAIGDDAVLRDNALATYVALNVHDRCPVMFSQIETLFNKDFPFMNQRREGDPSVKFHFCNFDTIKGYVYSTEEHCWVDMSDKTNCVIPKTYRATFGKVDFSKPSSYEGTFGFSFKTIPNLDINNYLSATMHEEGDKE